MRAILIAIAFGASILIGRADASSTASAVPFTFVDNRMTIQCMIDGSGPFTMIVDTGSPDVSIDPRTAHVIDAQVHNAGSVTGAGNKTVQIGATELSKLSIGSQSFTNLPASVIDFSEIRTKLGFPRLDGIIGYTVLKRFAVVVDADSNTISFLPTRPAVPSSATTTSFKGTTPVVSATIDGIPTTVILDTGDRSSLTLFGPFAKAHGFYGRYPSQANIITGYGLGGPVYGDVFTLPSMEVFGTHLDAIVARASRQTGGVFTSTGLGGSVGEGVLKRFNIIYDYPRKVIITWPNQYFATRDKFVPPPKS